MARDTTHLPTLAERLDRALGSDDVALLDQLAHAEPVDRFDAMDTLLGIYELWSAPVFDLDDRARHQNHPAVASLKWRLEAPFLALLDQWTHGPGPSSADAAAALRRIARRDDDKVYDWLATEADDDQLRRFLALEGGPDAGFDDLVATCQVGIAGPAKVVMGANYWDEMGCGRPEDVHTVLHEAMVAALDLPRVARHDLPQSSLDRTALNGLLATNRWLQPELVGALGLTELQAGPRCRKVVQALTRLGAPADALPFYEEHADTDPRHAKDWLDGVVAPLVAEHPSWSSRIVRGAAWRAEVNRRLFAQALHLLQDDDAWQAATG
ncbi:MAG TPA: iron-containing redox enzyme family protein [Acidimicrobiales bacterium]|nr:iron-containing redox enzyme family protein [Acidimicrobiales bacterium]